MHGIGGTMKANRLLLRRINNHSETMEKMSDIELQKYVSKLRGMIEQKVGKINILIGAFALVREVDRRLLNLYPTDEQILAALEIYYGGAVEVKTGEGKSLIATMPLFLKALYGKKSFLVTTNDYLSRRDYQRIGIVYEWLGLKVSDGSSLSDEKKFDINKKKEIYSADIIYISNSSLGFDYLIDGLSEKKTDRFIPELDFALLDEVDEILLDSAQAPLVISGGPKKQSNYFVVANNFVNTLGKGDYELEVDKKTVWLCASGIEKAKKYFSVEHILDIDYFELYRHIILALKAHYVLMKGRDYLIEAGEVKLIDRKDGRVLEGTNLQSGLHQAIQVKEEVELTQEKRISAAITYQNLFKQFRELSGMSGSVKVVEKELKKTYKLTVKKIKPHKKNIRKDHKPLHYVTTEAKINAVLKKILELRKQNRPILIVTGSVEGAEILSINLLQLGVAHNLLTAKNRIKEARIVAEAGQVKSVTVSTAMAGRGTDIKLSKEAIKNGGLAVLVTDSMLNKRMEIQAKGRAGRQGEPGDTFVFKSLEDYLISTYVQEVIQKYYEKHFYSSHYIRNIKIKRIFNRAQQLSEETAIKGRESSVKFDEIMRLQKNMVGTLREYVMKLDNLSEALELVWECAQKVLEKKDLTDVTVTDIKRFVLDNIDYNFKIKSEHCRFDSREEVHNFLFEILKNNIKDRKKQINDEQIFIEFLKITILKAIDVSWSKQVDALNQLRHIVYSRSSVPKKIFLEFDREAKREYENRKDEFYILVLKNVSLSMFEVKNNKLIITFP